MLENIQHDIRGGTQAGIQLKKYEEYTVQAGDTLNSIAFKKKTNTRLLRKINNFLTDSLLPGEVLLVPSIAEQE